MFVCIEMMCMSIWIRIISNIYKNKMFEVFIVALPLTEIDTHINTTYITVGNYHVIDTFYNQI
jgi:hypothetical protein